VHFLVIAQNNFKNSQFVALKTNWYFELSKFFSPTDEQLDILKKNNVKFALKFTLKSSYILLLIPT
jgi:hypothetical protein